VTRISLLSGALLGLVLLASGLLSARVGSARALDLAGGLLLLGTVAWGTRGSVAARVVMSVAACLLLARFLPPYFQTYRAWPGLVIVLLATLTMGFGVLGVLLDTYRAEPVSGPPNRS
jgi:hypothetical protein